MRRASPHTLAAYRRDITRVLDLAGKPGAPVAPSAWNRELLVLGMRSLHEQKLSTATVSRTLAAWRSFSRYCVRRGILETDPARELRFYAVDIYRPTLNIRRDERGILSVAGIEVATGAGGGGFGEWLLRQRDVEIHGNDRLLERVGHW